MAAELKAKSPLSFESHFVEIDGHRMHYLDEGTGPAVLLLHGNPTWCFFYRNLIEALRSSFRVIAPDHIGCGLSDHPPDVHFRGKDRAEHLRKLLQALSLERYSLVMHDWGGPIGTAVAVSNVDAVEKLVYLNTTLTETESLPAIIKRSATPVIGKFLTKHTQRFLKLMLNFGVTKRLSGKVRSGYLYPYRTAAKRTAIWDFVADIPFSSSHPTYADMLDTATKLPLLSHVPVKIIWGLKDPCFHRGMLSKVARHFPQASILEISNASHLVLEDEPETVCAEIGSFLVNDSDKPVERITSTRAGASEPVKQNALYEAFFKQVRALDKQDAVVVPDFTRTGVRYTHTSYRDLGSLINSYQRGLAELGLRAGHRVLMLVQPGVEFLALSYAVMARGGIPVFIDPGIGKEKLFRCIRDCGPDGLIGTPKAQLLRLKGEKLLGNLKFSLTASEWFGLSGADLSMLKRFSGHELEPVSAPDTCLIAFTSGATGLPKGVVFSNKMIRAELQIFADDFGIEAGKKDLPLLPIFSLFSLASGVTSVFPPINTAKPLTLDPQKVVKLIDDLNINYSFGSPTLWKKIAEYSVRTNLDLVSLEKVFMAGAPVPKETLERLGSILPSGTSYTPYGATEALPVTFVSAEEISAAVDETASSGELGTFVGKPVSILQLKIIAPADGPIASISDVRELGANEIGEVIVQGPNVSAVYDQRPEATLAAKIPDGDDFWHRMGDMGYRDKSGNLYFCGRAAHVVRTKERTYYSVPTERIFNAHKAVRRSALIPLDSPAAVGVVIEPEPQFWPVSPADKGDFVKQLSELAVQSELTENIEDFFFHSSFPVDPRHNAKIFRDHLAQWAKREQIRKGRRR